MWIRGAVMAKNEADNIERCVRSLLRYCDDVLVHDTGSTDRTVEIAESIPGVEVHRVAWQGFCASRTDLIDCARHRDAPFAPSQPARTSVRCPEGVLRLEDGVRLRDYGPDWLLMIDADMEVVEDPAAGSVAEIIGAPTSTGLPATWRAFCEAGDAGAGMIPCEVDGLVSRKAMLLRADLEWGFGDVPLHEAPRSTPVSASLPLDGLRVLHHGVAGEGRPWRDDVRILEEAAAAHPHDPRWNFYLAEAYERGKDTALAVAHWAMVLQMGSPGADGFMPEWAWYAAYRMALLSNDLVALKLAYDMRPWRAETPLALAYHFAGDAEKREWWLSYASAAALLAEPPDSLYVRRDVYRWGARFEFSCALAGNGKFDAACTEAERLIREGLAPAPVLAECRRNLVEWNRWRTELPTVGRTN